MMQSGSAPDYGGDDALNIFRGGSEMAALMRAYPWDTHPMGNPQHWPESLKANIRLMLNSSFPMFIWWSSELYMFHNDAYLPALGKKHPRALGASAREMWAEIWAQIGGITEGILETGEDFFAENLQILLDRKDFTEETFWTFSYSPAFNDAGEVEGIFCACNEETSFVLGQRRLKSLKDLSEALAQVQTLEQLGSTACRVLSSNEPDIPFSLVYFSNNLGTEATLAGKTGTLPAHLAPPRIRLGQPEQEWPLAQATQRLVVDLPDATTNIRRAAILPITKPGSDYATGFLIAGISPMQEYTDDYRGFHSLLAAQLGTSIASIKAREEILQRQEYLNDIFQQAPVGITMLRGPRYIVDIANPAVCDIWRVKQQEVLGKPILEVLPEAVAQGFDRLLDQVVTTGVPYVANEVPLVLERQDRQETVHLNFVYHPLRDEQGFVTGVMAVAIDISEQVRVRREVESINRELVATNADLDNFVYSASHDLKAPIFNIEGLVGELLQHLPLPVAQSDEVQQLSAYIQSSIDRFKRVVTDLTRVVRIQREEGEEVSTVNLQQLLEEVCLDFKPIIAESGATIETRLPAGATLRFSAKNLRSVMYNLISNALKYSAPNRKPYITISAEEMSDYTLLSIADNGLGLSPDNAPKIFSMFKRLHDHVEGSGIGLYIVKKIVENAGGRIEVESEVGKGSTFKVYIKR